ELHQKSSMELNNSVQDDVLERLADAEKLVHDKNSTEEMKVEEIKRELQEKEKLISNLQAQLHEAQSEQALKVGAS
ncbi:hypothetical protein U0070_013641, partial [Myodes glareolus]